MITNFLNKKYPTHSLFLLLFLFSFSLIGSHETLASSVSSSRLEQLVKDISNGLDIKPDFVSQKISCQDIVGEVDKITFAIDTQSATQGSISYQAFIVGSNSQVYLSNSMNGLTGHKEYTFVFTPVSLDQLCGANSYFEIGVRKAGGFYWSGKVIGSAYSNVYRDINYNYGSESSVKDLFFIINGVSEVNHPPSLNIIAEITSDEGKLLTFELTGYDSDWEGFTAASEYLPTGAVIVNNIFTWTPKFDQAGTYNVPITITDSGNLSRFSAQQDTKILSIIVTDTNPVIQKLEQLTINMENGTNLGSGLISQKIACQDIGGQIEKITFSLNSQFSTNGGIRYQAFVLSGNQQYRSNILTEIGGGRDYIFEFDRPIDIDSGLCLNSAYFEIGVRTVSSSYWSGKILGSSLSSSYRDSVYNYNSEQTVKDLYFIINPHALENTAPVLGVVRVQTTSESSNLSFTLQATDSDNDPLVYSATNLPSSATLNSTTGEFSWTPDYDDAGTYPVTFTATDDGSPALSDSILVDIVVTNTNRAPTLTDIGSQNTLENQNLTFTLSATDPDGDSLVYSANSLPSGSSFNPTTRVFTWTPTYAQAGNYENVEFTVTDNGSPLELDVELITITVGNINRAPEFVSPGAQEVQETQNLTLSLSAVDPDADTLVYTATNLPSGATFNSATRVFSWTPTQIQSGVYTPTFVATDDGMLVEVGTLDVVITVGDSPTPLEQAETLVNAVNILPLPTNVKNSYLANLQKVGNFITDGKIQPAINQLNAFINKVNQDFASGTITATLKNSLIAMAQQLIADIQ